MDNLPLPSQIFRMEEAIHGKGSPDLRTSLLVPFQKAIKPYLDHRNDGDICQACFGFFSRASRAFTFHPQGNTIKVSFFVRLHDITDFESFLSAVGRLLAKKNIGAAIPGMGGEECLFETGLLKESVASLKAQVLSSYQAERERPEDQGA